MTSREEVMTAFGEAMLAIQQFEEAMIGLTGTSKELASASRDDALEHLDDPWPLWESMFSEGNRRLRNRLRLDEPLAADVKRAVDARNLLAHHYLRDHAPWLESESGTEPMLRRLRDTTFVALG